MTDDVRRMKYRAAEKAEVGRLKREVPGPAGSSPQQAALTDQTPPMLASAGQERCVIALPRLCWAWRKPSDSD